MLPPDLFHLCCEEFATPELAREAVPANRRMGRDVIIYFEVMTIEAYWREYPVPPEQKYTEKVIRLHRLPSGLWAWIPSDSTDAAKVAEFKKEYDYEFEPTKQFTNDRLVDTYSIERSKESGVDVIKRIKEGMRQELFDEVVKRGYIEEGENYRISFISHEGPANRHNFIKIGYSLFLSKERKRKND